MWDRVYTATVLRRPWLPLLSLGLLAAGAAFLLPGFRLDADTESLTLETDPDRDTYVETRKLFGSDDYVIVAWAPSDPWSPASLRSLDALTREIEAVKEVDLGPRGKAPGIARVVSPTNQRLFQSLPDDVPPMTAAARRVTLVEGGADLAKARRELTTSALYGGNLVSRDGSAFALLAYFAAGGERPAREAWHRVRDDPGASPAENRAARERYLEASDLEQDRFRALVAKVRAIASRHSKDGAGVHASGIPTIVVDMVNAIEGDIVLFGVFATSFMVLVLAVALRSVRWVVFPMAAVLVVVIVVVAATVLAGKKTTVVTSNLSSLLLITGMAHAIHIAVHHREVRARRPDLPLLDAVRETLRGIAEPCLYACLTTAAGFGSIAISDVRPCIDFGLFMAGGVVFAYLVSFTLIPAGMMLLEPEPGWAPSPAGSRRPMAAIGRWTMRHPWSILAVSALVLVFSVAGMLRLDVETRFTDYFRADSELAKGLNFIDERIGGTTPLEVVLYGDSEGYFLEDENLAKVRKVHERLQALPEAGAVLSLASLHTEGMRILRAAAPAMAEQNLPLRTLLPMSEALLGKEEVRGLVSDYVTEDYRTARVLVRIRESSVTLSRQRLLADLRAWVGSQPDLAPVGPKVTGVFVLYTNMLKSLLASQQGTLGVVVAALFVMLFALFRSLRQAAIGMLPNVLPILFMLGLMGWLGIPLDMMTIMIASVSMGQAVDATIHYTHRFRHELAAGATPEEAVVRSHESIGRAIFFTSITVIGGFWVLVFSNFKPTIYFGLFTSVAMATAVLAALVLLPVLLYRFGRTR